MIKFISILWISSLALSYGDQQPLEGPVVLNIGESYDQIYFEILPSGLYQKWQFSTPNANISVTCRAKFEEPCTDAFLTIVGEKVCSTHNYTVISSGNELNIELQTIKGGGVVDCLVQSVNGIYADYYRDVGSIEIDSTERGVLPGPKSTSCKCGWSKKQTNRIVNGETVNPGEYPWIVALKTKEGQFCGGSIISEFHILTAAHCTMGLQQSEITVTVGSTNRITGGEDYEIAFIKEHSYNKDNLHVNDIAVITLKKKITFSDSVGPICMTPVLPNLENQYITVMGWGYLDLVSFQQPVQLQKAHMKVVNYKTCSWHWLRQLQTKQNRLCTWARSQDTCIGDSGGSVVWVDPDTNRYTLVGLVSFGPGCITDFPKVNTLVPAYNEWIQNEVTKYPRGTVTCTKIE